MAYRRNAVVLSRVSTASQELESQTTALLTNDTCRRFIDDYNESHTDKISVTYGHYTRKDEMADMKRMETENQ